MFKLVELKIGESFRIIKLDIDNSELKKRLIDMGFNKGIKGTVVRKSPFGDPIELDLGGYFVSVRKNEARGIIVEKIDASKLAEDDANQSIKYEKEREEEHVFDMNGNKNIKRKVDDRADKSKKIRIAIAGNPNAGKTTIFNALTGSNQHVGNYSGVTVEIKEGKLSYKNYSIYIYDLPGTYSLSAYSLDEVVARDFIIDKKPDLVVDVVDATNLERNLNLSMQIEELDVPMVIALNMWDEVEDKNINIKTKLLSDLIGIPMVKTVGRRNEGLTDLLDAIIATVEKERDKTIKKEKIRVNYGEELETEIKKLENIINTDTIFSDRYNARWVAVKLLERDSKVETIIKDHTDYERLSKQLELSRIWIKGHFAERSDEVISEQRYAYIHGAIEECVTVKKEDNKIGTTEAIDKILLHNKLALPIFFVIVWAIFQLTFTIGGLFMEWMEALFGFLSDIAMHYMPENIIRDIVVDAVIGGVGGMLVFVPNIVILFVLISILEDSGYMARAAFLMDKIMHKIGLHGRSFIPLMSGFGCAVPAIMGTRVLRSEKDRIVTSLVIPFMSCGARLPVYTLLIGAFFSKAAAGNILFSIYLIGIVVAVGIAFLLRKSIFKGESTPFVMELPPYRFPTIKGVLTHMWQKTLIYLKKAGTILLAASILMWFLTNFPKSNKSDEYYGELASNMEMQIQNDNPDSSPEDIELLVETKVNEERGFDDLEASAAAIAGKAIEPALKPLGFDWKMGIALISGLAAKEAVVSTLGTIYKQTDTEDSLREALQKDPHLNPFIAYCFMIFVLLYLPCIATLAVIKQELGSFKWVAFSFTLYMVVAYVVTFLVYNIGSLIMRII